MSFPTRPAPHSFLLRTTLATASAALLIGLAGCASNASSSAEQGGDASEPRTRLNADRASSGNARNGSGKSGIALLIEGEPVTWAVLRPLLSEANGDQIVEELALEHALRRELRARGITIGEAQIESARESWLALLEESGVSARAETEIRRRRGLGPERFERLLWRNAALRALLDPAEIEVTDTEVGLARTIRTGRRYMVTGVITRDSASALAIGERVRSGAAVGKTAAAALWEAADERALVPFRSVISPLDPAFPEAIRRSLPGLRVGEAGPVVAVDNGYASIVVDGVVEPTNDASGSAPDDASLRRELRIRKTRVAMERLARTLIDRTEVTRLDGTRP